MFGITDINVEGIYSWRKEDIYNKKIQMIDISIMQQIMLEKENIIKNISIRKSISINL